jgi:hypothetical protein
VGGQVLVAALGDHPAPVEQDHPLGQALAGRLATSGTVALGPVQPGQECRLGVDVDVGEGVVEDPHPRLHQERPGQRDPLALAAGQGVALLADHRVQALGQPLEHVAGGRRGQGVEHLLVAGLRAPEGDVVAQAGREQHRLLVDDPDRRAQRVQREAGDVVAVDQHPPLGRCVQPRDQPEQGRLARPGPPDHRHPRPRRDVQVDRGQRGAAPLLVGEADVLEPDPDPPVHRPVGRCGEGDRVRPVGDGRRLVEHLEDPVAAGRGPLGEAEQHPEALKRPGQQQQVAVERDQGAQGDLAVDGQPAPVPEDRGQAELGEDAQQGGVEGAQPRRLQVLVEDGAGLGLQAAGLLVLAAERLDHPDPGRRLLDHGGQLADLLLHLPVDAVQAAVEPQRPVDQRRGQGEDDQAEAGREQPHLHRRDGKGDQVEDHEDQAPGDEVAQRAHVRGGPGQQLPRGHAVVVGGLEGQQVAGQAVAQVVLDVGAAPPGDVAPQPAHDPADHSQPHQQDDRAAQHPWDPPGQPVVDDRPGHQRDERGDDQHDDPEQERHGHPAPERPHQADDAPQRPKGKAVGRRIGAVPAQREAPDVRGRVTTVQRTAAPRQSATAIHSPRGLSQGRRRIWYTGVDGVVLTGGAAWYCTGTFRDMYWSVFTHGH